MNFRLIFIRCEKMSFRLEFSDKKLNFSRWERTIDKEWNSIWRMFYLFKKYQQQHSFKFVWLRGKGEYVHKKYKFFQLHLSISLIFSLLRTIHPRCEYPWRRAAGIAHQFWNSKQSQLVNSVIHLIWRVQKFWQK